MTATAFAASQGEWRPAALVSGLATLMPEQTGALANRPASPGDLFFRQAAFSFADSTPIGANEGASPLGIFPTLQLRGQFLDRDITVTAGVNARFLPERQQFRLQESLGVDYAIARFTTQQYRGYFGFAARANLYQQFDARGRREYLLKPTSMASSSQSMTPPKEAKLFVDRPERISVFSIDP